VRPKRRFLTAEWRNLVMLNYEIDPAILARRVPAGCELDSWAGRTFVSVVGFQFLHTRVLGVPIPFHRHFEEVNLRFYVRRRSEGSWRRGVVFVKELVPRRAIALVACRVYGENYVALPMRHTVRPATGSGAASVSYQWRRRGAWEGVSAAFAGQAVRPPDEAEETFITEHYWGYARRGDRSTTEYQVEHPRWLVWRARTASLECEVSSLYGSEFVAALSGSPSSAFVADGSPVVVRNGRRLR
jgi:uncharacterized protein YqjF (DUF2071 family)